MTHTRILYWTKAVGEKRLKHDYVFQGIELKTRKEAEDYLDFGKPGNFLIAEAQGLSKYGILTNWKVTKVTIVTDTYLEVIEDIRKTEAGIEALNQKAKVDRKETKRIQAEIEVIKADTQKELEKRGWGGLTSDELTWFIEQGTKNFYFRPSQADIKAQYAAAHKDTIKDPFEGFEELRATNGWLSPDGHYFAVNGFAEHNKWASDYFFDHKIQFDDYDRSDDYEKLQDLGWLRVMDWGAGTKLKFGYSKTPTHDQKETLQLFCVLHKIEFTLEK